MAITFKGMCPCDDYEFTLRYKSPTEEPTQLFCPFCGVDIEDEEPDADNEAAIDEE